MGSACKFNLDLKPVCHLISVIWKIGLLSGPGIFSFENHLVWTLSGMLLALAFPITVGRIKMLKLLAMTQKLMRDSKTLNQRW